MLLSAHGLWGELPRLPTWLARIAHAANYTTVSPNMIDGGIRRNVIPEVVTIRLDVRTVVDDHVEDVKNRISDILAGVSADVEVIANYSWAATTSETKSFAWPIMKRVVRNLASGRELLPTPVPAATDARFFRTKGIPSYGFGLMSQNVTYDDFWSRFHGADERIDIKSLKLSTRLWRELLQNLLTA